ncbi:hypothetical protein Tco_1492782 [Tanacetum coccineum]
MVYGWTAEVAAVIVEITVHIKRRQWVMACCYRMSGDFGYGSNFPLHNPVPISKKMQITDDSIDTSTFNVNDIEKVKDSIEVKYVDELNDLNDNLKEMEKDKGEDDIPIENFNESVNDVQSKQHVVQEENKPVYFSNDDISSNLILKHEKKSISHHMARGRYGGLISMWDPNVFVKDNIWCDESFIITSCFILMGNTSYLAIRMWSEKKTEADHFNSFIDSTGLNDLPIRGRAFTWMNKAGTKLSKLDRFLISEAILEVLMISILLPLIVCLGPLDCHALEIQVSIEEIKTAIWDCDSNKALGPDGFSFAFVKKYWDIIKMDIF